MKFVATSDRTQLEMACLKAQLEPDNPVRFIDPFVDKLDLERLGFQLKVLKNEGRPALHPAMLLKLHLLKLNSHLDGLNKASAVFPGVECTKNSFL